AYGRRFTHFCLCLFLQQFYDRVSVAPMSLVRIEVRLHVHSQKRVAIVVPAKERYWPVSTQPCLSTGVSMIEKLKESDGAV
ncbi:MAG: hypothetical protein P8Z79_18295, partial [Sedimentisphaerales bacterium]